MNGNKRSLILVKAYKNPNVVPVYLLNIGDGRSDLIAFDLSDVLFEISYYQ